MKIDENIEMKECKTHFMELLGRREEKISLEIRKKEAEEVVKTGNKRGSNKKIETIERSKGTGESGIENGA